MKALFNRRKSWWMVGSLGVVLLLWYGSSAWSDRAAKSPIPMQSASDASVSNRTAAIRFYEGKMRDNHATTEASVALAQLYLAEARATRNEAWLLPKAQTLLDRVLTEEPRHEQGRAVYASLLNVLHRFEQAEALAAELIAEGNRSAFVHGVRIDALVELGRYEEAVEASDALLGIRPGMAAFSRAAYLRELHGDGKGAKEAMTLAAEAGPAGHEDRSWALYQLGQLVLAEDELDAAERLFDGILEEDPEYALAFGGLGQVALLRGDYDEALYLFDAAYGRLPDDRFLEGKAETVALLGRMDEVKTIQTHLKVSLDQARSFGENVDMEYADFLLDLDENIEIALEWATSEYQRRPGHLHALETYAWGLHKNDRSAEGIPYIEQAMRLDTGDAMVYYRAAEIYAGAGDLDAAKAYFEKSLDTNLHIESPTTAEEVRKLLSNWSI